MTKSLSILVLSSNTYPSVRNSKEQKKILLNQPNGTDEIYWYKQGTTDTLKGKNASLIDNDLFIDADDSSLGMGFKTLLAFEWMLKNSNFKYLFRTNTSSFVWIDNLKKFIDTNYSNSEYVYSGLLHSTNDKDKKNIDFASGSGFLLNRKTVELIVEKQKDWEHEYWDDVSLGLLLRKNNISPQEGFRFDIKGNVYKQEIDLKSYHFRCRIDNHYNYPRFLEKYVLRYLSNLFSNNKQIKIFNSMSSFVFEISRILYIHQFGWKVFMNLRKILKSILPIFLYSKLKKILNNKITKFKLKRFKI